MALLISDNKENLNILNDDDAMEDLREEIKKVQTNSEIAELCNDGPLLIKENSDGSNLYLGHTKTLDNVSHLCFFWSNEYHKDDSSLKPNTIDAYSSSAKERLRNNGITSYDKLAELVHTAIPNKDHIMPIVESASEELSKAIE